MAQPKPPTPLPETESEWVELLLLVPGYDPFADTVMPGVGECVFSPDAAAHVINFFQGHLRHVEGAVANQLFVLERWQMAILANLFGWLRPDGFRRYREAFIYVPKKNGKSPLVAGMVPYLLCFDGENAPQIYSVASTEGQAAIMFKHVSGMVRADEELNARCRVYGGAAAVGQKLIACEDNNGVYKVLPYMPEAQQGLVPHAVMIDELHTHPTGAMYRSMASAFISENRKQPMLISISTADYDRPDSICNEVLARARKVRDGVLSDPTFFPALWELAPGDDWKDERNWAKVNPNLGVSVSLEALRAKFVRAQASVVDEQDFRRYNLNEVVSEAVEGVNLDDWRACKGEMPSDGVLSQYPCFVGLDLSSVRDLTAMQAVWKLPDGRYATKGWVWVPGEAIEDKSSGDRAPYAQWERDGHVERMGERTVSYDRVFAKCAELVRGHRVVEFDVDPAMASDLMSRLSDQLGATVFPVRPTFPAMTACVRTFQRLAIERRILHGGSPVMLWALSNVALRRGESEAVMPSKKKSTGRIDPYMALIMALHRASIHNSVSREWSHAF